MMVPRPTTRGSRPTWSLREAWKVGPDQQPRRSRGDPPRCVSYDVRAGGLLQLRAVHCLRAGAIPGLYGTSGGLLTAREGDNAGPMEHWRGWLGLQHTTASQAQAALGSLDLDAVGNRLCPWHQLEARCRKWAKHLWPPQCHGTHPSRGGTRAAQRERPKWTWTGRVLTAVRAWIATVDGGHTQPATEGDGQNSCFGLIVPTGSSYYLLLLLVVSTPPYPQARADSRGTKAPHRGSRQLG